MSVLLTHKNLTVILPIVFFDKFAYKIDLLLCQNYMLEDHILIAEAWIAPRKMQENIWALSSEGYVDY